MRGLRPLRLPELVELRRKAEEDSIFESPDSTTIGHSLHLSQSSTSSDTHSPVTPTFSLRNHSRFPSSTSSLASSPTMHDSLDGFANSKRPLTEVKEDPYEREEDFELLNSFDLESSSHVNRTRISASQETLEDTNNEAPMIDYDLEDYAFCDEEYSPTPYAKRRCSDESTRSGMTSRLGSRFPSLSRKWKDRRAGNRTSVTESLQDGPSRASSLRAPSFINSPVDSPDRADTQYVSTPARSVFDECRDEKARVSIDIRKANAKDESSSADGLATTPLLPPLMVDFPSGITDEPIQSPLQSPTIADSSSNVHTPIDTCHITGLPSPPLSAQPSISSFYHRKLVPPSDIPPIELADPFDEWTTKLGHANFTIYPKPYVPSTFNLQACKQLRADWDTARCNYMKHLVRTGEHYGTTSKIYKLTEDKWMQVESRWKHNNELTIARAADQSDFPMTPSQSPSFEHKMSMKMPPLNGPKSEGKFPKLDGEDIVGPMVRRESQLPRRSRKKRTFWKFLQGVLPSGSTSGR